VLSIDGVHALADVIIINPAQIDLVLQAVFSCGVVMTITTQVKDGFYCNQFLTSMFLPLVMKIFRCLHQQVDEFSLLMCQHGMANKRH
jgi:hypothetical protein